MTTLERRLLDEFQRNFPLGERPFAEIGARLGIDEATVIDAYRRLAEGGTLSRIGATLRPNATGASTLAAMAVPPERLEAVADLVSAYEEVNHNYEREHRLNLWFVVTGRDRRAVVAVLDDIAARTGLPVLDLPMEEDYRLDLGFPLRWS